MVMRLQLQILQRLNQSYSEFTLSNYLVGQIMRRLYLSGSNVSSVDYNAWQLDFFKEI